MVSKLYESDDVTKFNLSYFCRECKQTVMGIPLTQPQYENSYSDTECWLICRCPNKYCALSFVIYDRLNDNVRRVYPFTDFKADDYHESIPEEIREDLAEASRCYSANSYKATIVMLRRVVQSIILDKINDPCIKKKKLWEQIDELFNQGFITKNLKEAAHEVRQFGNFGAHPSDDDLDKTTREETLLVDRLIHDLLRAIYISPYETEKLKIKRGGQAL